LFDYFDSFQTSAIQVLAVRIAISSGPSNRREAHAAEQKNGHAEDGHGQPNRGTTGFAQSGHRILASF
jgi:hypothetical protein